MLESIRRIRRKLGKVRGKGHQPVPSPCFPSPLCAEGGLPLPGEDLSAYRAPSCILSASEEFVLSSRTTEGHSGDDKVSQILL